MQQVVKLVAGRLVATGGRVLGCQLDVWLFCWVTDWLSRRLDESTAGCAATSNQRERD